MKTLTEVAIEKAKVITGKPLDGFQFELKYSREAHHYNVCLNLTLVRNGFSLYNRLLNTDDVALLEMFFEKENITGTGQAIPKMVKRTMFWGRRRDCNATYRSIGFQIRESS